MVAQLILHNSIVQLTEVLQKLCIVFDFKQTYVVGKLGRHGYQAFCISDAFWAMSLKVPPHVVGDAKKPSLPGSTTPLLRAHVRASAATKRKDVLRNHIASVEDASSNSLRKCAACHFLPGRRGGMVSRPLGKNLETNHCSHVIKASKGSLLRRRLFDKVN